MVEPNDADWRRRCWPPPRLLTEGRSPAPRAVADLLIALRDAGAVNISPPVCAGCGNPLRTFQRRGEHWYCSSCGPKPRRCASCGRQRIVASLDRCGRPRCSRCPERDDRDPVQVLTGVITALEPALPAEAVTAAIGRGVLQAGQRCSTWPGRCEDRPELLTGAGAQAPVPARAAADRRALRRRRADHRPPGLPALRSADHPADTAESTGCGSAATAWPSPAHEPCSRCGALREAATRDEHGRPLCPYCLITDPANQETCVGCRRRRPVSVRTPDGPLCPTCRPARTMTCSICGRAGPAVISKATGQPWCRSCRQLRARCTGCGNVRPVRGGTRAAPLCATCTRPDPTFWQTCPGCGEPMAHRRRRCGRCTLRRRLDELLAGATGVIHPQLHSLHEHLANHDRPDTVLAWLNKDATASILRELAASRRTLSHAVLDALPDGKPLRHLRAVLVATGALPPRDEHLLRLERWITATIAERGDAEQRALLHRYAVWHLLRRLRGRTTARHVAHTQTVVVQQHVRAAITVLDWLAGHHLELGTARQGDLDAWLASGHASRCREAGHFIRWARRHKQTSLEVAATRWDGPNGALDAEERWAQARRLLHDNTIRAEDRVAGLLVLLYAQRATTIARLTLHHVHVHVDEQQVRLRLGREPIQLPEPLAELVLRLVTTRRGHAALGEQGSSRWLFPGGRPGQPISAEQLTERLRQLGLRSGQARSTALFGLAAELPAAMLARLLGIHMQRRRLLAARQQRRLDQLRRRLQPSTQSNGPPRTPRPSPILKGIRTGGIPDSARDPRLTGAARGLRRGDRQGAKAASARAGRATGRSREGRLDRLRESSTPDLRTATAPGTSAPAPAPTRTSARPATTSSPAQNTYPSCANNLATSDCCATTPNNAAGPTRRSDITASSRPSRPTASDSPRTRDETSSA